MLTEGYVVPITRCDERSKRSSLSCRLVGTQGKGIKAWHADTKRIVSEVRQLLPLMQQLRNPHMCRTASLTPVPWQSSMQTSSILRALVSELYCAGTAGGLSCRCPGPGLQPCRADLCLHFRRRGRCLSGRWCCQLVEHAHLPQGGLQLHACACLLKKCKQESMLNVCKGILPE